MKKRSLYALGAVVLALMLAVPMITLAQRPPAEDVQQNPPDREDDDPGGGAVPEPWPMRVEFSTDQSSVIVRYVDYAETTARWIEISPDGMTIDVRLNAATDKLSIRTGQLKQQVTISNASTEILNVDFEYYDATPAAEDPIANGDFAESVYGADLKKATVLSAAASGG